jgi:hypothetical protein
MDGFAFELHKNLGCTSSERRSIVKIWNKVMSVLFLGTNAVYMVAVVSMTIKASVQCNLVYCIYILQVRYYSILVPSLTCKSSIFCEGPGVYNGPVVFV